MDFANGHCNFPVMTSFHTAKCKICQSKKLKDSFDLIFLLAFQLLLILFPAKVFKLYHLFLKNYFHILSHKAKIHFYESKNVGHWATNSLEFYRTKVSYILSYDYNSLDSYNLSSPPKRKGEMGLLYESTFFFFF